MNRVVVACFVILFLSTTVFAGSPVEQKVIHASSVVNTELLREARAHNFVGIQKALLNGADVNARDQSLKTSLHLCVEFGRGKITELLILKGADVNAKDKDGWTPLHLASRYDRLDMVEFLVSKGADVNAKDKDDLSPLHLSASFGSLEMVRFFISSHADINAKNKDGCTPLGLATFSKRQDIVALMSSMGASAGAVPVQTSAVPVQISVATEDCVILIVGDTNITTRTLLTHIDCLIRPLTLSEILSYDGKMSSATQMRALIGGTASIRGSSVERADGKMVSFISASPTSLKRVTSAAVSLKNGPVTMLDLQNGKTGEEILRVGEPIDDPLAKPLEFRVVVLKVGNVNQEYQFQSGKWVLKGSKAGE